MCLFVGSFVVGVLHQHVRNCSSAVSAGTAEATGCSR